MLFLKEKLIQFTCKEKYNAVKKLKLFYENRNKKLKNHNKLYI